MNISDLIIGESYQFTPLPSAIWPTYTNARFLGQVSYDVAANIRSVANFHAAALGYLPTSTQTDPTKLQYLLFKVGDTTTAMATVWINLSTLTKVSTGVVVVTIANASLAEQSSIRSALASAGYIVSSIA